MSTGFISFDGAKQTDKPLLMKAMTDAKVSAGFSWVLTAMGRMAVILTDTDWSADQAAVALNNALQGTGITARPAINV